MFKSIPRYPDYEINEKGDIRRKGSDSLRKTCLVRGRKKIILKHNGRTEYVSRLVAETHIPNTNKQPIVRHLDGNNENNHIRNLEWTDRSTVQKDAYGLGIYAPGGNESPKRIVVLETGEIFPSIRACARAIGGSPSGIRQCLNGEISKHKGKTFKLLP